MFIRLVTLQGSGSCFMAGRGIKRLWPILLQPKPVITVQHLLEHLRQTYYIVVQTERRTHTQAKSTFCSLQKTFLLLGVANPSQLPGRRHAMSVTLPPP